MTGYTKSILLQVAFKGAVAQGTVTKEAVTSNYQLLVGLHESLGIDSEEGRRQGGGSGFPKKERKPLPDSVKQFTGGDGTIWNDWRGAKAAGDVVAGFPEFKTEDNKTSCWLYTQSGEPTEQGAALAAIADAMLSLTEPF